MSEKEIPKWIIFTNLFYPQLIDLITTSTNIHVRTLP